jgi:hypothetical protein
MTTQRLWKFQIEKENYTISTANNISQVYLLGYICGKKVRTNDLYFSQREKDRDSYKIEFVPKPSFISFSFFSGLFDCTLQKMSIDEKYKNISKLLKKDLIIEDFFNKYCLDFKDNTFLSAQMKSYVEQLIEGILDDEDAGGAK